jgi:glycosyltransferase involved in cell wall biosynthesis
MRFGKRIERILLHAAQCILETALTPVLFWIAILCRVRKKSIDVGLGPEPLINNVYHKKVLELYGYRTETFVSDVYFVTNKFDVRGDKIFSGKYRCLSKLRLFVYLYLFIVLLLKYKCVYIYFNGGPLGFTLFLWRVEPFLYKLANVKVVVMPYGSDVQDMSRSPNLLFKHAMARDYPGHRFRRRGIESKIDLWTKYADHVIGGCEWVDYMYHWDTLMLGHFSIDVDTWKPVDKGDDQVHPVNNTKLRILHAPNHRTIKGTQYFIDAVNELVEDGLEIELVILERVPNEEVRKIMASVDIVADQLIVGWYAMFALEAMAMEKPVLCYLREDLQHLYVVSGLVSADEIPIINCSLLTVKETIRDLVLNRDKLPEIGKRSREYVIKHHSTQAVGKVFDGINRSIGLKPSNLLVSG